MKSGSKSGFDLRGMSDQNLKRLFQLVLAETCRRELLALFKRRPFPFHAGETIRAAHRATIHKLQGSPKPYDVEELRLAGV
jgi:hypothetical protein